jgi:hypothetical protein
MFTGPSRRNTIKMAQEIASYAMQIRILGKVNGPEKAKLIEQMKANGVPTTMRQLIEAAASVAAKQKMGRLRKNQYLGAIQGHLVNMGMSDLEATSLKNTIEVLAS